MHSMKFYIFLLTVFLFHACSNEKKSKDPSDYVDYVVMGKSVNHRQDFSGKLELLNTVFFAEIFPTDLTSSKVTVTNGKLTGPGEAREGLYFSTDRIPFLAGQREMTIEKLSERYPDGTYNFSFNTPVGSIEKFPVSFSDQSKKSNNPNPIKINLSQNGEEVNINAVNSSNDLKVSWTEFTIGSNDPNEIIDDMIYVILGDCMGNEIAHSGHAISDPEALTFDKTEFIIKSTVLSPGSPYQLEVEHSNMETAINSNIEIIVTKAATSFLDFRTQGENMNACPELPFAMDGGQTDRVKK